MNSIEKYYKLCKIKTSKQKIEPLISQIDKKATEILFTNTEVDLYFIDDKGMIINDEVIGGQKNKKILVI